MRANLSKLSLGIATCCIALGGCASKGKDRAKFVDSKSVTMQVERTTLVFTSFGFYALTDALRTNILLTFDKNGQFNPVKFSERFPRVSLKKYPTCVRLEMPEAVFPVIYLADGPLISLGPESGGIISQLAEMFSRKNKSLPVIPIR